MTQGGVTVRPVDFVRDEAALKGFLDDRDKMRFDHCQAAVDAGDAFVFVADDGGKAIGWVVVHLKFRDDQDWDPDPDGGKKFQEGVNAYVENIEVTPRARSTGVGTKLLEAAQVEAKSRGKKYLWLHTNENNAMAHKVFERLGWVHDSSVYPPWKPESRMRIYKKALEG